MAALSVGPERDAAFVSLASVFAAELAPMLPADAMAPQSDAEGGLSPLSLVDPTRTVDRSRGLSAAYSAGSDEDQDFVQNLALFLTTFLRAHLRALEADPAARQPGGPLLRTLDLLASVSFVPDEEVFKICLDFWHHFVPGVYAGATAAAAMASAAAGGSGGFGTGGFGSSPPVAPSPAGAGGDVDTRRLYARVLSRLRALMIARMAKPEEVIVVEDPESGTVVREAMKVRGSWREKSGGRKKKLTFLLAKKKKKKKDTDTLARYKTMHETLVYLAHLDHEDTERQMHDALRAQLAAKNDWSWGGLNTLCWAVGSISGSMAEDQENRFLVTVIRDLLNLCEVTRGKDNKAVIAANIMYVVGQVRFSLFLLEFRRKRERQSARAREREREEKKEKTRPRAGKKKKKLQYPRFLRNHWKFLKTVVNKLFEFMHETHPGVQDMACETFLKICHKCRRKFVVQQLGEAEPFVCELLTGLSGTIQDLEAHQVHMFYEAVGLMVGADADAAKRAAYLERLMAPPNATWDAVVASSLAADPSGSQLLEPDRVKSVTNILQTNTSVCASLGAPFAPQMARCFGDVLRVFSLCSSAADAAIAEGGPHADRSAGVKALRGAKRAALRLLETWVGACDDVALLSQQYVPAMADPILGAYARARSPESRDAETLALYAAVVGKLRSAAAAEVVPRCFDAVFGPTLEMITANFEDFPEHRLQFFALLRSVAGAAFGALFGLGAAQLKLLVDAVVWAFRHTERNVAETGLNLLLDLLQAFERSPAAAQFYQVRSWGFFSFKKKKKSLPPLTHRFAPGKKKTDLLHAPGPRDLRRDDRHLPQARLQAPRPHPPPSFRAGEARGGGGPPGAAVGRGGGSGGGRRRRSVFDVGRRRRPRNGPPLGLQRRLRRRLCVSPPLHLLPQPAPDAGGGLLPGDVRAPRFRRLQGAPPRLPGPDEVVCVAGQRRPVRRGGRARRRGRGNEAGRDPRDGQSAHGGGRGSRRSEQWGCCCWQRRDGRLEEEERKEGEKKQDKEAEKRP